MIIEDIHEKFIECLSVLQKLIKLNIKINIIFALALILK